jgi:3',5'-cyclic-AMP phosphodiesterase
MPLFAHISDTHLDGDERARERTHRVMTALRGMPLDAVLVTGDVADSGAPAEYEEAAAELVADVPVLVLPGNHDERAAFRKGLLGDGSGSTEPLNQVVQVAGVTFALCDSSIPGRDDGLLAPETLEWLRGVLADAAGPVLVCLHHPPVALHQELIDGIRLGEPEGLAAIVTGSPDVVAVLCGHAHLAGVSTFAGRPLVVAPGVVSTLRLPWTTPEPLSWANALDLDEPPGVAFHVLDDAGRLTSHLRAVRP